MEIAFRIALKQPEYTYFFTKFDSGIWSEDPELFWVAKKEYRENMSAIKKPHLDHLVYCLGGSITRGDFANTSFCKEMEKCLPEPWKVVNFATSGYSSHQSLILMKRAIKITKPTLVLVSHGWNDSEGSLSSDYEMTLRNKMLSTRLLYWVSRSKIVQALRKGIRKAFRKNPYALEQPKIWLKRVDTGRFKNNIQNMGTLAAQEGFPLILLSQGVLTSDSRKRLQPYFEIMAKLPDSNEQVHFLDIGGFLMGLFSEKFGRLPIMENDGIGKYLFLDLCHLNDFGHGLVGEYICDYIKSENLLN